MASHAGFVLLRIWDVVEFLTAIVQGWKAMDVNDWDKVMEAVIHATSSTCKLDHTRVR